MTPYRKIAEDILESTGGGRRCDGEPNCNYGLDREVDPCPKCFAECNHSILLLNIEQAIEKVVADSTTPTISSKGLIRLTDLVAENKKLRTVVENAIDILIHDPLNIDRVKLILALGVNKDIK